jgi:hypothetical protein
MGSLPSSIAKSAGKTGRCERSLRRLESAGSGPEPGECARACRRRQLFAEAATWYVPNLKKYRAIAMEAGLHNPLAGSNRDLDQSLTQQGVPQTFETFEGDHADHLKDRIEFRFYPSFRTP